MESRANSSSSAKHDATPSIDNIVITCAQGDAMPRQCVLAAAAAAAKTQSVPMQLFYVNVLAMDMIALLGRTDDVSSMLGPVAALKSMLRASVEWHPFPVQHAATMPATPTTAHTVTSPPFKIK